MARAHLNLGPANGLFLLGCAKPSRMGAGQVVLQMSPLGGNGTPQVAYKMRAFVLGPLSHRAAGTAKVRNKPGNALP